MDEPAPHLDPADRAALEAWNLAGGCDWQALPLMCDVLGIEDLEGLVRRWAVIRDGLRPKDD